MTRGPGSTSNRPKPLARWWAAVWSGARCRPATPGHLLDQDAVADAAVPPVGVPVFALCSEAAAGPRPHRIRKCSARAERRLRREWNWRASPARDTAGDRAGVPDAVFALGETGEGERMRAWMALVAGSAIGAVLLLSSGVARAEGASDEAAPVTACPQPQRASDPLQGDGSSENAPQGGLHCPCQQSASATCAQNAVPSKHQSFKFLQMKKRVERIVTNAATPPRGPTQRMPAISGQP